MTCTSSFATWLAKNVVREIPGVGHTLVHRNLAAFFHDMKHLVAMMAGMLLMMVVPLPMASSSLTPIESLLEFLLQYVVGLLVMYVGVVCVSVLFNILMSSFGQQQKSAQLESSDLPGVLDSDAGEHDYLIK